MELTSMKNAFNPKESSTDTRLHRYFINKYMVAPVRLKINSRILEVKYASTNRYRHNGNHCGRSKTIYEFSRIRFSVALSKLSDIQRDGSLHEPKYSGRADIRDRIRFDSD